jgi:hypothetical protein
METPMGRFAGRSGGADHLAAALDAPSSVAVPVAMWVGAGKFVAASSGVQRPFSRWIQWPGSFLFLLPRPPQAQ